MNAVAPAGWFPRRGEVCLATLDKLRPVLIVSSDSLNRHSLDVCVIPISTAQHKAFALRPKLEAGVSGLKRQSWAKCDQVTTIEKKLIRYPALGALDRVEMEIIEGAVKQALELP